MQLSPDNQKKILKSQSKKKSNLCRRLSMRRPLSFRHHRGRRRGPITWKVFAHLLLKSLTSFRLHGLCRPVKCVQRSRAFLEDVNGAGIRTQVAAAFRVGAEGEDRFVNFSLAAGRAGGTT